MLLKRKFSLGSSDCQRQPQQQQASFERYVRAPKNLREKSSKQNGGQPGHQGHTLRQVENPDYVKIHRLDGCCRCGRKLSSGKLIGYKQRQVFDLPPGLAWKPLSIGRKCEDADAGNTCGTISGKYCCSGAIMAIGFGRRMVILFEFSTGTSRIALLEVMRRPFQRSCKRRNA